MFKLYIFDEVNQDYKSQVTNINNKVKQYQDAKQAVSSINNSNLDSAIRNAQSTPGVKLIDDGTQNVIANVNNYADKKATVERDNQQQADNINAQVQQYRSDLQNYLNKINNNSSVVSSNEIIQNLTLANEWDAKVSYQVTGNNIKQSSQILKTGDTTYGHGIDILQGKQITVTNFISDTPQTFKVTATFTGLKNSSYQGRKITKLVEIYTITPNTSARGNSLGIYSDPTNGFEEVNSKVNISYEFYYEDGTPVNFEKGTAYLALGSLNNYQNGQDHYEYAKVISGGKALGLAGSSVSVHNGNTLYSTYPNTARESEYGADSHYNTNPQHSPDFDKYYGWDTGWVNSKAFYGSGLVSLEGSKYTFEVGVDGEKYFATDELRNNLPANHLWYNMATVIPKTDIQKPKLTVHYHHTNVELQQPEAVHYHLDSSKKCS
ncbi:GbpC/Spa domain-containing protein [Ligilactobacillus salivarius]|uniref:Putative surface protein n=1 Tax=Ligilactobacillus salivarius TaxID=1624 RepID=A0A089QJ28_9LACO|nr:GbpC/Spa domain-containing protein [Ligilactobacillus salivarius]AIR11788.1 Putative surface protein [Ligilactobacillus salivarius]